MNYMTHDNIPAAHEWWKEQVDPVQQRAFLTSYRSAQQDLRLAAWRRNLLVASLFVLVPVLIHLLTA